MNKEPTTRFTWNMHYTCNYRCPYCFYDGKWIEYQRRNVYLSVEEWMAKWDKISERYGRCYVLITGGEPFIYPNFIDLIERLSRIHYPINISTNASGDLGLFTRRIDPGKVSLSVSLQLYFEKLDSFVEKVRLLKKQGFLGGINFVAYPPFVQQISLVTERLKAAGGDVKIIPFWGKYHDKDYPSAYTQEEKKIIGIDDSWLGRVRKKGMPCSAGYNSALIFPEGKVVRCGQIGEKLVMGNFFDPEFKLLDEPLVCEAEFCPCDENELFGKKERKVIKSGCLEDSEQASRGASFDNNEVENSRANSMSNSSLNDLEYNSGKTILQSSPKAIFIQAAGPCNLNCVFCSRGSGYEVFDLKSHQSRFGNTLYPFLARAEQLILTGSGEFLRLPDAENILSFFDDDFPHIEKVFSTNGSSLTPLVCDRIINSRSKHTIHISLHASNAGLHKAITRADNFNQITNQIKYLIESRKNKHTPRVHLIFVATTLNIEDLPNFIQLAASLRVDKVIGYYNYIYIPTQKYLSCFFKQELTNKVLDEARETANRLSVDIDLPLKFGQKEYPVLGPCREAFSQIMFDSQGRVLPCDASEDCGEVLGNGKSLMDIWNSPYYQKLRKTLLEKNSSCFKHCFRANPACVNDFRSHVIHRGIRNQDVHILWGDNF